ncbi:MAG TPA: response regulator [Polyangia bacterium]|nr:response regulator [Polyangia bacterium]
MSAESSAAERVLVVEDEPKLRAVLVNYLQAAGYRCTAIDDGAAALNTIDAQAFDLILLDWMLPGMDGLSICREVRRRGPTPIIMITARVDEADRLIGLDAGADDYVCKPFSPREVVARAKAILRRSRLAAPSTPAPRVRLRIEVAARRALLEGTELRLTQVEFRLIAALAHAPGKVWSRDRLLRALYEDSRVVTDRTVDTHVKNLRRKLQAIDSADEIIASVYGVGYRMELSDREIALVGDRTE